MNQTMLFGLVSCTAALFAAYVIFRRAAVAVEPFSTTLILRFGKVIATLDRVGFHWVPGLWVPGTTRITVSRALEGFRLEDVHVNDRDGTTMRIDLWVESQVVDPSRALFAVEDWRESLRGVLKHALMSAAGTRRFEDIVADRTALGAQIQDEVLREAKDWGITICALTVQEIRVLPEVTRQLFDRVAAQIEMEKSRLEEEGRIAVHQLEAETERQVAELRARARSHRSLAVGRAYSELNKKPVLLDSYEELHRYTMLQPGKTTTFMGFGADELSVLDAAMLPETTNVKSIEKGAQPDFEDLTEYRNLKAK